MVKLDKLAVEDIVENDPKKESVQPLTSKEIGKAKLAKIIEEEGKHYVKGRFRNYETPGASAEIQIRKFPEDKVPMFKKRMNDNEIYEIPLYVARHLNGTDRCAESVGGKIYSCSHLVHGFSVKSDGSFADTKEDDHGMPVPIFTNKYRKRYGFESLEFDS
jgi:hypothetical protein